MADEVLIEDDEEQKGPEELTIIEDERPMAATSGDDEHDGDDGDDRDAIRERRRREKQERKERREKAMSRDKLELDFLRRRNDELERRLTGVEAKTHQADIGNIDRALQEAIQEAQMAEKVIAKAVEAGNGDDVTQAMRYRDAAIVKAQQLNQYKQSLAAQAQAQMQANKAPVEPKINPNAMELAKEFIQDNPWYDPTGKDEDSSIVLAIDNALVREGLDPASEEYWDELRDRVKKRLPEKFGESRKQRGAPALGSGREHAPASTRREVYISPERKQALMDAGVWDDPVLRQRYVKKYMEYDRANGRA